MLMGEMVRAGNKASLFTGLYHSNQGCKGKNGGSRPVGSKVTWEILIYKLREVHSKGPALADRLEMSEPIKGTGERERPSPQPPHASLGFSLTLTQCLTQLLGHSSGVPPGSHA